MLRVLATFDPNELPFLEDGLEPEDALDLGIIADDSMSGSASDRSLSLSYDPRPGFRAGEDDSDFGVIGETAEGVWLAEHPITLLCADEDLWPAWSMWRAGVRDLTRADFLTLTAFDLAAHGAMMAAHGRALSKPRETDADADEGSAGVAGGGA